MKIKYTLLLIILLCIIGNIYCVSSILINQSKIEKTIASIDYSPPKIIKPIDREPNEDFIKLVREKHLFGTPERNLKLIGILGESILLDGNWYKEGEEKNGIFVLSVNNDSALVRIENDIIELKLYLGKQTLNKEQKIKKKGLK